MHRKWKKIEFPPKMLYMNLETRNRWHDEVGEDGISS
jgi:hypothetical protein